MYIKDMKIFEIVCFIIERKKMKHVRLIGKVPRNNKRLKWMKWMIAPDKVCVTFAAYFKRWAVTLHL